MESYYAPLFPETKPTLFMLPKKEMLDDDAELTRQENEWAAVMDSITYKNYNVLPLGKNPPEEQEEEEEDEYEDSSSDTHEEEYEEEMEVEYAP